MQLIIFLFLLTSYSLSGQSLREYSAAFGTERILDNKLTLDTIITATIIAPNIAKAREFCNAFEPTLKYRVKYTKLLPKNTKLKPCIKY